MASKEARMKDFLKKRSKWKTKHGKIKTLINSYKHFCNEATTPEEWKAVMSSACAICRKAQLASGLKEPVFDAKIFAVPYNQRRSRTDLAIGYMCESCIDNSSSYTCELCSLAFADDHILGLRGSFYCCTNCAK